MTDNGCFSCVSGMDFFYLSFLARAREQNGVFCSHVKVECSVNNSYVYIDTIYTGMRWHKKWRSVRVDLSSHDLEASRLGGTNHWGTFAADQLFDGMKQYYAEIEILSLGKNRSRDKLVIGLVSCSSKGLANLMDWQNGKKPIGEWDTPSLGFFPIYGLFKSHVQPGKEVAYGQDLKIQVGDRIGVLVDMGQQKLSFFCNGTDLGVAADSLQGKGYLLAVSIRDKIRVRLRIPPPPYAKRHIKLIKLRSSQLRL